MDFHRVHVLIERATTDPPNLWRCRVAGGIWDGPLVEDGMISVELVANTIFVDSAGTRSVHLKPSETQQLRIIVDVIKSERSTWQSRNAEAIERASAQFSREYPEARFQQ